MTRVKYVVLLWVGIGTFAIASCGSRKITDSDILNLDASLPATVPVQVLDWKVLHTSVDREQKTISTLSGNDVAVNAARKGVSTGFPAGAILALTTWSEVDDPHWFGAKIHGKPVAMEIVRFTLTAGGETVTGYERYAVTSLARVGSVDGAETDSRVRYITTRQLSVMP